MLYEVMKYCREFFPKLCLDGSFVIKDGVIRLPETNARYILIEGSMLNDGVFNIGDTLEDETFTGYVTLLAPPKAFLDLVEEIEEWQKAYGTTEQIGPYSSESFGGYSYQKATNASGKAITWKDAFSARLNDWRLL